MTVSKKVSPKVNTFEIRLTVQITVENIYTVQATTEAEAFEKASNVFNETLNIVYSGEKKDVVLTDESYDIGDVDVEVIE